jgi:hypothetical protein
MKGSLFLMKKATHFFSKWLLLLNFFGFPENSRISYNLKLYMIPIYILNDAIENLSGIMPS